LCGAVVLFCISSGAQPPEPVNDFIRANELYREQQYEEAIRIYEQILRQDYESASLHFNLGNAYLKESRLGQAIASYLRALRINPRDPDIQFNLKYARALQVDQGLTEPQASFTGKVFAAFRDQLTLRELFYASAVLFWFLCLFIGLWFYRPQWGWSRALMWSFLILYLLTAGLTYSKWNTLEQKMAVIIQPTVSATSGPDASATLFTLHEGATGIVTRRYDGWIQIRLPNGLSGWVKREQVELV
jgi:tetratricopeptide (TPR) repeat protein